MPEEKKKKPFKLNSLKESKKESKKDIEKELSDKFTNEEFDRQTEMQLKSTRTGKVCLFTTGLSDDDHALTGVERISDMTAAIAQSMAEHNDSAVAVIPEGPYVVPVVSINRSGQ